MAPCDLVPASLSDRDLLSEVVRLAACERAATASLVALLAEVEARQLHLAEGCSSLFAYCTERLHLSGHAAYHRIEAARVARRFPVVLEYLRSGALTVTAVTLLGSHLTEENHQRLLKAACGHSKREVELLVRTVAPLPSVRASVRRLPMARDSSPPVLEAAPASSTGFALDPAAQDLMRHMVPDGDPAVVVERALALLVEQLERKKFGAKKSRREKSRREGGVPSVAETLAPVAAATLGTAATSSGAGHRTQDKPPCGQSGVALDERGVNPGEASGWATRPASAEHGADGRKTTVAEYGESPGTTYPGRPAAGKTRSFPRHIPAPVKREVWTRDEGRCAFIGAGGRCRETGRLEFHHRIPVADGGAATVHNLELRCTAHHRRESELWFGESRRHTLDEAARPGPRTSKAIDEIPALLAETLEFEEPE